MVLTQIGLTTPTNLSSALRLFNIILREEAIPGRRRGQISRAHGQLAVVLSTDWHWRGEGDRRWVIAEEFGHLLLEHPAIVASTLGEQPWMHEARFDSMEKEARTFAAELLMPAELVTRAYSAARYSILRERSSDERTQTLAEQFKVTKTAMGYRLEGLKLVKPREERWG